MFTATIEVDLLLGDITSLKQKRSIVRPLLAEIRRRHEVSAAEVGFQDLYRRALLGVAVCASDAAHCQEVLDTVERLVANHPEVEILSVRRRCHGGEDD